MSAELIDFRGKLTEETHCALEAVKLASGTEHSETVREVMHKWALQKIREATILQRLVASEGNGRESQGKGAK